MLFRLNPRSVSNSGRFWYPTSSLNEIFFTKRKLYSQSKKWPQLSDAIRHDIDKHWFPIIEKADKDANKNPGNKSKCYVLSMFPYPSGALHLGHLRVYTVTDVLARFQRMTGHHVIQPMGWDAFGLPAENAAIDRGLKPDGWTYDNIISMKEQLRRFMSLSLDWSREVATCHPGYYKWTQWLFLQLHQRGLAYKRSALVNWDPVDETVLADELVDSESRSWRSGAIVERRPLRQWYFKTTAFFEPLLKGLESIEGQQWRDVIQAQRGWIGKLDGTFVDFVVKQVDSNGEEVKTLEDILSVFTRYPSLTLLDAISHIALTKDSLLCTPDFFQSPLAYDSLLSATTRHSSSSGDSTSVLTPPLPLSLVAVHPLSGRHIPLLHRPDLVFPEEVNVDAEMGIPSVNDVDKEIAEMMHLQWKNPLDSQGNICDPTSFLHGMSLEEAFSPSLEELKKKKCGGYASGNLRTDWLISRQRYWGTPIPIIYCRSCGEVPVPSEDLPVVLPQLDRFSGKGKSPLLEAHDWLNVKCPKCGDAATRETDTMDTFVDSSWYFLRYLDPRNEKSICDRSTAQRDMPVDIYVGGIEHAIRHLFYARFIAHFLHSIDVLPQPEPFVQFLPVGLVMGLTHRVITTGKYIPSDQVEMKPGGKKGSMLVERETGLEVAVSWDKMSKSKYNGVDPCDVVTRLGIDTVRLAMIANSGPHRSRKWQEGDVIQGVINWQKKVWNLVGDFVERHENHQLSFTSTNDPLSMDSNFLQKRNLHLGESLHCYEKSFVLSAIVARLQTFTDLLKKVPSEVRNSSPLYARSLCDLVVILAPISPLFANELWTGLQTPLSKSKLQHDFPYDMALPVLEQQMTSFSWTPDAQITEEPQRSRS